MRRVLRSVAVSLALSTAAGAADLLPGASSDDHLWVVAEETGRPETRIVLRHHARRMTGPYLGTGLPLAQVPAALAAWGNRVWLVFPPQLDEERRRETFTVQVDRNPAFGSYYNTPPDRLVAVESLDGLGKLAGFVGTAQGPVALLQPTQRAASGVRTELPQPPGPMLTTAKLLQLHQGRQWVELRLPDDFRPGRSCRLGAAGADGQMLVILTDSGLVGETDAYWRTESGSWTHLAISLDLARLRGLTRVGANVALITESRDRPGRVELAYLRQGGLLALPGFSVLGGRWAVLGLRDGLRLIEQRGGGGLTMRRIDPLTGTLGPTETMTPQPLLAGRILHRPLLLALAVTAVLFAFLFRPGPQAAPVALPPGVEVLPPMRRLVAILIDLAVAGVVTVIVLGCSPRDLLRFPFWAADITDAIPCLLMVALTVVHSTITEVLTGRTLGKLPVGARVVSRDGSRPPAVAILARNIFKTIVLLIPVLAIFALLNPHVQGLGDQVARTVVVRLARR